MDLGIFVFKPAYPWLRVRVLLGYEFGNPDPYPGETRDVTQAGHCTRDTP